MQDLLLYNSEGGSLLAPLRYELRRDRSGRSFAMTNKVVILHHNPPNLAMKRPGDTVRIAFDVSDLIELTLLRVPHSEQLKTTLNVNVPFAIIAAATGQHHLVPDLAGK